MSRMDRTKEHIEGYRRASKDAVEWLHNRGRQMNDPHAKLVLDCAADHLGSHLKSVASDPLLIEGNQK